MLYEINKEYYILVENRYVKVNFIIKDGNVEVVATNENIDKDNNVNAKSIVFNDEFKESIKNKREKKQKQEEQPTYFQNKRKKKLGNMSNENR